MGQSGRTPSRKLAICGDSTPGCLNPAEGRPHDHVRPSKYQLRRASLLVLHPSLFTFPSFLPNVTLLSLCVVPKDFPRRFHTTELGLYN